MLRYFVVWVNEIFATFLRAHEANYITCVQIVQWAIKTLIFEFSWHLIGYKCCVTDQMSKKLTWLLNQNDPIAIFFFEASKS